MSTLSSRGMEAGGPEVSVSMCVKCVVYGIGNVWVVAFLRESVGRGVAGHQEAVDRQCSPAGVLVMERRHV